jgi:cellulose synthase/poly-beta-1,6-N-acetylglucosamine synthase-like glycosyltransferase
VIFVFPVYLLVLLVFINRYFGGMFLKKLKGPAFDATIAGYEPTVTVVIPLFNEGEGIYHTIKSLLEQDYPAQKLDIIVVDDCSTDDSYTWAKKAEAEDPTRVKAIKNPYNMGKRRGINHAVRHAKSEIIVSVDSDVIVERTAVRKLISRFTRPSIAAVGGRVCVSNPHENWLTRMQTIKYFFGYEYLKNLERYFSSVMCLSGCLTAYRRHVLIELEPILEDRNVFGIPIKYGEDRFLTRQVVKAGYETTLTLDAICWTVAPNNLTKYFAQQLRWRRSNLIDFMCGMSHAWRLHPIVCVHYLSLFGMLVSYPLVIMHNLMFGGFWDLAFFNVSILALFGMMYWWDTRKLPADQRVHPIWFLPMAVVMPVTYLIYSPLALFTLDSSSWETRGKPPAPAPDTSTTTSAPR